MRLACRHVAITTIMLATTYSSAYADGVSRNPPHSIPGGTVQSAVVHKAGQDILVEGFRIGRTWLTIASPDIAHATLKLGEKTLDEAEGGMNFKSVTQANGHTYVVIGDMLGGAADSSHIKVLDVSASGAVLSPDLGQSGDDQPKVIPVVDGIKIHMTHDGADPDRNIYFVHDQVQAAQKESATSTRFDADECVGPKTSAWHVYAHPQATEPVPVPTSYYGLFVTKQVPGWTGLSTEPGNLATKGWMRTAELRDFATRVCAANPQ